jgi:hypothetical protein
MSRPFYMARRMPTTETAYFQEVRQIAAHLLLAGNRARAQILRKGL